MTKRTATTLTAAGVLAGGYAGVQFAPTTVETQIVERVVTPMDIANPQRSTSLMVWDKDGEKYRVLAWQHKLEITRVRKPSPSPQSESEPEVVFSASALEPLR